MTLRIWTQWALAAGWASVLLGNESCPASLEAAALTAERQQSAGLLREAENTLRDSLTLPDSGLCADGVITRLGHLLQFQGRFSEAEQQYRRALRLRTERRGPDSAAAASSLSDISTAVLHQGRIGEAEELLRRALGATAEVLGPDHPDTLAIRNNLGVLLVMTGQPARAQPVLKSVVAGFEKQTPRPLRPLAVAYRNLAGVHSTQNELSEAARYTRLHLDIARTLKDVAGMVAGTLDLRTVALDEGKFDQAEPLLADAFHLVRPSDGANFGRLLVRRAAVRRARQRYEEAGSDLREAVSLFDGTEQAGCNDLAGSLQDLASVRRLQGNRSDAKAVQRRLKELLAANEELLRADPNEVRLGFTFGRRILQSPARKR